MLCGNHLNIENDFKRVKKFRNGFFSCLSHNPPFSSFQVLVGVASRKTYWILFTFARPSISLKLRPTGIKLLLWMNINAEDLQTELWTVFLTQWQTRKLHSLDLLSRKTQGTRGIIMDRLIIVVLSTVLFILVEKIMSRNSLSGPKNSCFFVNQSEVFILFQSFSCALGWHCVFSWNWILIGSF